MHLILLLAACSTPAPEAGAHLTGALPGAAVRFDSTATTVHWEDASLSLRATSWGRDGDLATILPAPPLGTGLEADPVTRHHGAIEEWWVSLGGAYEQGFTVTALPPGDGPLVVDVALDADSLAIDADGLGATLLADGHSLRYDRLSVSDARGASLPATLEASGDGLRIVVDDRGAVAPVVIDPFVYTVLTTSTTTYIASYVSGPAGDVNADGYADAIFYDGDGVAEVHYGGASGITMTVGSVLGTTFSTGTYEDQFEAAGDINGDGYDDVVAGEYSYNSGRGGIWTFHGSASGLSPLYDKMMTGRTASLGIGNEVAAAGDVNGDGFDDVITGTSYYPNPILLFYGGVHGLRTRLPLALTPPEDYSGGGQSVRGAGDVNGDGYDDVVIGSDRANDRSGAFFLYYGSAAGLSTTATTYNWSATNDHHMTATYCSGDQTFANSVIGIGDVNGDGYDDVGVGSSGEFCYTGFMYIYYGSASGLVDGSWTEISGWNMWMTTGSFPYLGSLLAAGDFNGDSRIDLVGSGGVPGVAEQPSGGYPIATDAASAVIYATQLPGISASDSGQQIHSLGDTNGDGCDDLLAVINGGITDTVEMLYGTGGSCGSSTTTDPTE